MKKKENIGFKKASQNKTSNGIRAAYKRGEHPKTHKKLAEMMDRLYDMDYIKRYYSKLI